MEENNQNQIVDLKLNKYPIWTWVFASLPIILALISALLFSPGETKVALLFSYISLSIFSTLLLIIILTTKKIQKIKVISLIFILSYIIFIFII